MYENERLVEGGNIGEHHMFKIMYFLEYTKRVGGAASTLFRQAMLMKERGQQIRFIISNYMGNEMSEEYQKMFLDAEMDVLELTYPISPQTEDIDIVSVIENYAVIKAAVKEYEPDILHSVQLNPVVELVSRELHIPHVMNIYQAIPAFFSINYLNIFSHYHICDSQLYADMWSSNLKIESICIRTVAHQTQCIKQTVPYREEIKFVCVGAVVKRKNQMEVIRAFHKALQYGIKGTLTLYGYCNGLYAQQCQEYVVNNNLSQNVIFKGFCTDMQSVYKNSDVLICGSTSESYPNVISEALASGNIIISVPVAGVPETIKHGINGFLCRGFSAENIFEQLLEFDNARKAQRLEKILDNAFNTYRLLHSPEAVSDRLWEFYVHLTEKYVNPNSEIQIAEIRRKFTDIITIYKNNIHKFSGQEAVRRKLWYLYHIRDRVMKENTKCYIWGTGGHAVRVKEMLNVFFPEIEVKGFIDSYREGYFLDYVIEKPEKVIGFVECIVFVAAVNGQQEIITELEATGKECNRDYFILAPRVW